jgi:putative hydrolase of the HAD superfamily
VPVEVRAVLFDAAGVLIEPAEPVGETYSRLAARHGVDVPARPLGDAFRRALGRMPARVFPDAIPGERAGLERDWWHEAVRQTFQATDSTARFADFEAFFSELYSLYAMAPAWRLAPCAAETLTALRASGLATGAVSNFDHRLPKLLEDLGIASLLDVVIIPSQCGAAKPDGAIFRHALDALGVRRAATVYVSHDPEEDAPGAAAAGLQVLLVADGGDLASVPARLQALATLRA